MPMIYVVPSPGGRIRQPDRGYVVMPAEGAYVPQDAHYTRLLVTGDVIAADPPRAEERSAAAPAAPRNASCGEA